MLKGSFSEEPAVATELCSPRLETEAILVGTTV
jgi:hypothetical protein